MTATHDSLPGPDGLAALVRDYLTTGNQEAVDELVHLTRPRLLAVATRIAGATDVEDVVQSAYLSLFRKREIPADLPVLSWLVTAAVRIAYRQRALGQKHTRIAARLAYERPTASDAGGPEGAVEAEEERELVRRAVDALPDRYRDVVLLHYGHGLSTAEVGELLGIPHGTVCSWLHRARALLRARLSPRIAHLLCFLPWLLADRARAAGVPIATLLAATGATMKFKTIAVLLVLLLLSVAGTWQLLGHATHRVLPATAADEPSGKTTDHPLDRTEAAASSGLPVAGRHRSDEGVVAPRSTREPDTATAPCALPGPGDAGPALPAATPPVATFAGVVVDPGGFPAAGARVVASRSRPGVLRAPFRSMGFLKPTDVRRWPTGASATTDGEGRFELEVHAMDSTGGGAEVQTGGRVTLFAVAEEHCASEMRELPLVFGTHTAGLELSLRPAAEILGVVIDSAGSPLEGATVTATLMRPRPRRVHLPPSRTLSCRTDASGAFAFRGLPPDERFLLAASHRGLAMRDGDPAHRTFLSGTKGIVLELVAQAVVRGTVVTSQGQPVSGAEVELRRLGRGGMEASPQTAQIGTTDPGGAYEVAEVPAGAYRAICRKEGLQRAERAMDLAPGEVRESVDFQLGDAGEITGRISDDRGRPLAGVRVIATLDEESSRAVTGADGSFILSGIIEGSHALALEGRGVYTLEWNLEDHTARAGDHIEIVLPAGVRLLAWLVDELGAPVQSVWYDVMAQPEGTHIPTFALRADYRNPDGRFEIHGVPPEALELRLRAHDSPRLDVDLRGRLTAPEVDFGTLVFRSGATLRGRVLLEGGEPAVGAALSLWALPQGPEGGDIQHEMSGYHTDGSGAFAIPGISEGWHRVHVQLEPYRLARIDVQSPGTGEVTGLDVVLARGGAIGGQVLGSDGMPLGAASLSVLERPLASSTASHPARTDAGGLYEVSGLDDGDYEITLLVPSTVQTERGVVQCSYVQQRTITNGQWVACNFDLSGMCRVHGRVIGWAGSDQEGVEGVVSLEGTGGRVHAPLEVGGRYELPPVPAGSYRLTVWRGSSRWQAQSSVEVQLEVPAAHELAFDVQANGGTVSGRVVRRDGGDAAGAAVVIHGGVYLPHAGYTHRAEAGAGGAFTIRHVPAGVHSITAVVPRHGQATLHDIAVSQGEEVAGLSLVVDPAGRVRLIPTGIGPEGGPLHARLEDAAGQPVEPTHEIEALPGEWLLSGVPPGRYRVLVSTLEQGTAWVDGIEVLAGQDVAARVFLASQSGTIDLTVQGLDPEEVPSLTLRDAGGRAIPDLHSSGRPWLVPREEGRADLRRLPGGSYTLELSTSAGRQVSGSFEALAGVPLHLVLDVATAVLQTR